jgi:hypothetical protein
LAIVVGAPAVASNGRRGRRIEKSAGQPLKTNALDNHASFGQAFSEQTSSTE